MIFSYIRVSTDIQEKKFTYETQRYKIQEELDKKGLVPDYEFKDLGISGKDIKNRPNLQELLNMLFLHPGSHLYVYDQDRLTREPKDWFILKDLFKETGTIVHGVYSAVDLSTPEGELFSDFKSIIAKYERIKTNIKVRHGVQRKMKETGHWGPKPKITDRRFDYYYKDKGIVNKTSLAKLLGVSWPTVHRYMQKRGLS